MELDLIPDTGPTTLSLRAHFSHVMCPVSRKIPARSEGIGSSKRR
jgi:hypothetical protein